MQCPECGYQLTPFDKDCPRCTNFAAKGLKSIKPERIDLNIDSTRDDTQPAVTTIVNTEAASSLKIRRNRLHPVLIAVIALLVLFLGYDFSSVKQTHDEGNGGVEASQQTDSKVERIKSEGVQQCIAGDEEGCTYAMDKLRDADDYDDAEFLKLHIIVSLTLNDQQAIYRDSGGATIAEYEAYAKKLGSNADLLASEGNSDYKVVEKGIECAKALAEYGKSHNLIGRY